MQHMPALCRDSARVQPDPWPGLHMATTEADPTASHTPTSPSQWTHLYQKVKDHSQPGPNSLANITHHSVFTIGQNLRDTPRSRGCWARLQIPQEFSGLGPPTLTAPYQFPAAWPLEASAPLLGDRVNGTSQERGRAGGKPDGAASSPSRNWGGNAKPQEGGRIWREQEGNCTFQAP